MKTILSLALLLLTTASSFTQVVDNSGLVGLIKRSDAIIHVRVTFANGSASGQKVVTKLQIVDFWKKSEGIMGAASLGVASRLFRPGGKFSLGERFLRDFIVFSGHAAGDFNGNESGSWSQYFSVDAGSVWFYDHYVSLDVAKAFTNHTDA